jgi:hypothetical protein
MFPDDCVVLTFATVFLISLPVLAQQDQGRIGGVIKDANGAIVPVRRYW